MMANYTMEIRQMIDEPLIGLFTFNYDFYTDDKNTRKEFERLFIEHYYFREIGFETPERFKMKLKAKLDLIMPYYRQLAMTEWERVRTVEQMMTSKNLKETSTHEQKISGQSSSNGTSSNNDTQSGTNGTTSTSSQSTTQTDSQTSKTSTLNDGVSQASLNDGYLTGVSQTQNNSTNELSVNNTSSQNITSSLNSSSTHETNGNNVQTLTETNVFESKGDIGIQTPAYAITEWRKVLININKMIIDECNDLFMKIY